MFQTPFAYLQSLVPFLLIGIISLGCLLRGEGDKQSKFCYSAIIIFISSNKISIPNPRGTNIPKAELPYSYGDCMKLGVGRAYYEHFVMQTVWGFSKCIISPIFPVLGFKDVFWFGFFVLITVKLLQCKTILQSILNYMLAFLCHC